MLCCEETVCDMHSFTHLPHLILHVIYYIWLIDVAFMGWEKLKLLFTCVLNAFNWMSLPASASTHPTLQIFLIRRTFCAPLLFLHLLLILLKSTGWSVASGEENHSIRLHRWNESQEVRRKEGRKKGGKKSSSFKQIPPVKYCFNVLCSL